MSENPTRVLVVDDEPELRGLLQRYLQDQGLKVRSLPDTSALDRLLGREQFDVLVLDVMLPGEDGLAACRRLREAGERIPIIMLTARGNPVDRVLRLEMGADDYLGKPFSPRELLARIHAQVRRQHLLGAHVGPRAAQRVLRFGPYLLYPGLRQLRRDGEEVALSSGELALLMALAEHPNRPLGRERLIELAHGRGHEVTDRSIDVQVMRLRRLLEADPARPQYIRTVRNLGYVFVPFEPAPQP